MITTSTMGAAVQPSATLAAGAKAKRLRAEGKPVLDFSLGEPDFRTPEHICQAAVDAMNAGHTRYTAAGGILELRQAIVELNRTQYGLECALENVVVSSGAKHSLHNALSATCGPGDEVLIPAPYWVSYSDLVVMTGATTRLIPTTHESHFKMTADQLRAAITPRSKLLMFNSPCNPTGTVYTHAELEQIADVVLEAGLAVLSDEIYDRLTYDGGASSCFASVRPGLKERVLTVNSVSKSYAMTGWRIGWTVGPAEIVRVMENIQSQQTSSPCSISQYAALAAIRGEQNCVEAMRREFEDRRNLVHERLSRIPGIVCPRPGGAFYAFFSITGLLGKAFAGKTIQTSKDFCDLALEKVYVNMVPGSAFGAEGYVRLSFASKKEQLAEGMDRLEQLLS